MSIMTNPLVLLSQRIVWRRMKNKGSCVVFPQFFSSALTFLPDYNFCMDMVWLPICNAVTKSDVTFHVIAISLRKKKTSRNENLVGGRCGVGGLTTIITSGLHGWCSTTCFRILTAGYLNALKMQIKGCWPNLFGRDNSRLISHSWSMVSSHVLS